MQHCRAGRILPANANIWRLLFRYRELILSLSGHARHSIKYTIAAFLLFGMGAGVARSPDLTALVNLGDGMLTSAVAAAWPIHHSNLRCRHLGRQT